MSGNNTKLINDCNLQLSSLQSYINSNPLDSNCPYLISYSVIKSCGTIEKIYKNIIYDHLSKNANSEAVAYFEKTILESSSNPSCGQIMKTLDLINSSWKIAFENCTSGMKEKGDLKSLVNLRNDFAHGQNITSSINDVIDYFNGGCTIITILNNIVK